MSNRKTFICEANDCNNEKTVSNYAYNISKNHYCSRECAARSKTRTEKSITFTCSLDGCDKTRTEFASRYYAVKKNYCSRECFGKDRKHSKVTFTCDIEECDNQRTVFKSQYENSKKHYCSNECKDKGKERAWITFTCNDARCNNKRTMRKSQFYRKGQEDRLHYCSHSCAGKNSGGNTKSRGRKYGYTFNNGYNKKPRLQANPELVYHTKTKAEIKAEIRDNFKNRWNEMEWK